MLKYHPDKAEDPDSAREIMTGLKMNIELLRHPTKRQLYDKYGEKPDSLYDLKEIGLE